MFGICYTENVVHLGIFGISGIPKLSVLLFNTIEYWKCSLSKCYYYWIPKMVNIAFTILLKTEKNSNPKLQCYQKLFSIFFPTLLAPSFRLSELPTALHNKKRFLKKCRSGLRLISHTHEIFQSYKSKIQQTKIPVTKI